jgi:hypothetical protein
MSEPPTPEEARASIIAELTARPGPMPRKPIPADLKAEILREMEWESDEEYTILMLQELEEQGGYSGEEVLAIIEGKPVFRPNWY